MLPNLVVIGAPRSGTTSLYEYLDAHQQISMSTVKEPDFFSRRDLDDVHPLDAAPGPRSLQDDADGNPALAAHLRDYLGLWSGAKEGTRLGEASAVYLGHPTAAWHLKAYLPDARFVAVLRDPVERAYSHYVHGKRIYAEHGQSVAVGAEGRSVDEEWVRAIEEAAAGNAPQRAVSDPEVWVRSGFYHEHLTRWFELFPREQILLFLYEDLVRDPHELMRRTYEFVSVDPGFVLPTTEAFNASVVPKSQALFGAFTTRNPLMRRAKALAPTRVRALAVRTRNRLLGSGKPNMDADLRRTLRTIYRADTEALQGLIGRDLSGWLEAGS